MCIQGKLKYSIKKPLTNSFKTLNVYSRKTEIFQKKPLTNSLKTLNVYSRKTEIFHLKTITKQFENTKCVFKEN